MAHGVVRTDKLYNTDVRTGPISVKYLPSETPTDIDNGNVVLVGGLIEGEYEMLVATTPAANSDKSKIALIATPEVMYDERLRGLDEFYNVAGRACRAYYLHVWDIFSVTKDALDGAEEPAVGDVVELKAGTKLNVVAAATGATQGSTVIGEVIDINVVSGMTFYAIRVTE